MKPLTRNAAWSLPTVLSANPIASPIAHAGMHVTAVVESYETDVFLPPHRPKGVMETQVISRFGKPRRRRGFRPVGGRSVPGLAASFGRHHWSDPGTEARRWAGADRASFVGLFALLILVVVVRDLGGKETTAHHLAAVGLLPLGLLVDVLRVFTGDASVDVADSVRVEVDTTLWPAWVGLPVLAVVASIAAFVPWRSSSVARSARPSRPCLDRDRRGAGRGAPCSRDFAHRSAGEPPIRKSRSKRREDADGRSHLRIDDLR